MQVRVGSITRKAPGIHTYELVDPAGAGLAPFSAGSHIDVHVPGGFVRQYSLCNDPGDRYHYVVGVLDGAGGRGRSKAMHRDVRVGDVLTVSAPRNNFPRAAHAGRHLLIAGRIGVTPMMAMEEVLCAQGAEFDVLVCTCSPDLTAFRDRLAPHAAADRVTFHHDEGDRSRGLDVVAALRARRPGTHAYCCDPTGLINAVKAATLHWPAGSVHFEVFARPAEPVAQNHCGAAGADTSQVRLASYGAVYAVPAGKSIVDVMRENGVVCKTSCEAGVCGTCRTRYLESVPEHHDFLLNDAEDEGFVLICCARSRSDLLVLDR